MGYADTTSIFPLSVTERDLCRELADFVQRQYGVDANLASYGLERLTDTVLTPGQANEIAYQRAETEDWGSGRGCYARVYAPEDVTSRRVEIDITAPADTLVNGRLSPQVLDAAVATVRLNKGEIIERKFSYPGTPLARKIEVTVPKEKTVTRYYAVTGTTVNFAGDGHASQAEARAAAIAKAKAGGWDVDGKDINVVGVTKRESGAPLVTVTSTPTKVEFKVIVQVATIKAGARQGGWFVYGTYHH